MVVPKFHTGGYVGPDFGKDRSSIYIREEVTFGTKPLSEGFKVLTTTEVDEEVRKTLEGKSKVTLADMIKTTLAAMDETINPCIESPTPPPAPSSFFDEILPIKTHPFNSLYEETQRQRVYRWEQPFVDAMIESYHQLPKRETMQAFVSLACDYFDPGKLRPRPTMRFSGGVPGGGSFEKFSNVIYIDERHPDPCTKWVLLHEVCHWAAPGAREGHGPDFVSRLIKAAAYFFQLSTLDLILTAIRGGVQLSPLEYALAAEAKIEPHEPHESRRFKIFDMPPAPRRSASIEQMEMMKMMLAQAQSPGVVTADELKAKLGVPLKIIHQDKMILAEEKKRHKPDHRPQHLKDRANIRKMMK